MKWRTRVTELLGGQYPILQGALHGFGNWQFAAAVAETGAHGTLTASVSKTPERLRDDIRRCREATDKSFGVNLTFGACPRIEEMLEACLEERVGVVETAAYIPKLLASRIQASGATWIHKTARVKDALHAEKLGADAVIVVGLEGVGFKHPLQLPTLTTTVLAARKLKIPFIAAGGIADARGLLGAMAMGAEGIMMGTAFLATHECPISTAAKEAIVQTAADDPQLLHRVLAPPDPEAYKEVISMRRNVPLDKWLGMLERVNLKDPNWKAAWGNETEIKARLNKLVSLAAGLIDHVPTVKELIDGIIRDAEQIVAGRQFLKPE
ncbi:NAD(P)H-dependent flavin oxidoreductase [Chloroflexota bacterium]